MASEIERLQVGIEIDSSKMRAGAQSAKKEATKTANSVNEEFKKVKNPLHEAVKNDNSVSEWKRTAAFIKSTFKDIGSGAIVGKMREMMQEMKVKSGALKPTDAYLQVQKDIDGANAKLDKLYAKSQKMQSLGSAESGRAYQSLQYDIKKATAELDKLYAKESGMEQSGQAGDNETWNSLQKEISKAEKALERLQDREAKMQALGADQESKAWKSVQYDIQTAEAELNNYKSAKQQMESEGSAYEKSGIGKSVSTSVFSKMKSALDKVRPSIQKTSGTFGSLIKKFVSGIPIIGSLARKITGTNKAVNSSNSGYQRGLRNILMYGVGIRSLFALFNKLRSIISSSITELAGHDSTLNSNLSLLKSQLNQLKGAFATAFAPILNAITPALSILIDYLISACNAVARFMAALTGQSSYTVAKRIATDFSAAADSTNSASSAAEKYKKTLMGFDQINKLDDSSSDSSSGSGGSSGNTFGTETLPTGTSDFAQKLKEAWGNADWKGLGVLLGNKVNDAINGVDWGGVGSKIGYWLNASIQTAYWLLDTVNFTNIGSRISELLNNAMENVDFSYIGRLFVKAFTIIPDMVIGAVNTLDWGLVTKSLSDIIVGIFNEATDWLNGYDWWKLGNALWQDLKDAVEGISFGDIAAAFYELLGAAIRAKILLIGGFFGSIGHDIKEWFDEEIKGEDFAETGANILKAIGEGLVDIGLWVWNNIVNPFCNGLLGKDTWSDAKEGGEDALEGFQSGVKDKWESVKSWFANLPGKIRSAIGDIKEKVKGKGSDIVNGIKSGFENKKGSIKSAVSGIPGLVSSGIGSLWSIGRNAISTFADGFGSLNIKTPHIDWSWKTLTLGSKDFKIPSFNIQWYAKGGFPENGQMFIANEAGPEMVGRIGNRTAVANNDQIVTSIENGVRNAVSDVMADAIMAMRGQGSGGEVVNEVVVQVDSETAYRIVKKGKEKSDRRYHTVVPVG